MDDDEQIEIVPVNIEIEITKNGKFIMEFNQDMIVPFDFSRRMLQDMQKLEMSYQSFNVTRDLVKMDFGEEMGENLQGI